MPDRQPASEAECRARLAESLVNSTAALRWLLFTVEIDLDTWNKKLARPRSWSCDASCQAYDEWNWCSSLSSASAPTRARWLSSKERDAKTEVVPIGERDLAWVAKYVGEARGKLVASEDAGHLFLSETGSQMHPTRLTNFVGDYVRKSGIAPHGACHLLRHVMATAMLENGAYVRFKQEMLGHASLGSTQIHTHVSVRQLKPVHAATHPAAQLLRSEKAKNDGTQAVAGLISSLNEELMEELEVADKEEREQE